jgi:hypothetical protein
MAETAELQECKPFISYILIHFKKVASQTISKVRLFGLTQRYDHPPIGNRTAKISSHTRPYDVSSLVHTWHELWR